MNPPSKDLIYWTAEESFLRKSRMAQLAARHGFGDYRALHAWSVESFPDFWREVFVDAEMIFEGSTDVVYVPPVNENQFYGGEWFPDVQLNFAENLMSNLDEQPLVALFEDGRRESWSRTQVEEAVANLQSEWRAQGVGVGDVVAACLPHCPEAVIGMLATTALGAIWTSCSPDFGVQGIVDRFGQVEPKVFITCDQSRYNGKAFSLAEKNAQVIAQLPSLKKVYTATPYALHNADGDLAKILRAPGRSEITFERRPFSHPAFVLYSSGTTGAPKCIVHSAGGTLLQLRKEHRYHGDLRAGEGILYFTTCGWMMWNWVVASLAEGARLYCYDGSPAYPRPDALFKILAEEKIVHFGTSARFLASLRSESLPIAQTHDLHHLRTVYSTGSPLLPEDFDYFYANISPDHRIQLASISGGTDIVSCFMLGNPLLPVIRGEIQAAGLGYAIEARDERGRAVIGEKGELVCTQPFPSMPVGFWRDADGSKYRKAYFEKYPGIWHHGDYITIQPSMGVIVHGRSDTTLNPGGVRIGTAEIYRAVETLPEISDSLVVGQSFGGDERVLLFVKLKDHELSAELKKRIQTRVRELCSPRHVPAQVLAVKEIPYTVSGKKVELAVKEILHDREPKNIEALANPAALNEYRSFRQSGLL